MTKLRRVVHDTDTKKNRGGRITLWVNGIKLLPRKKEWKEVMEYKKKHWKYQQRKQNQKTRSRASNEKLNLKLLQRATISRNISLVATNRVHLVDFLHYKQCRRINDGIILLLHYFFYISIIWWQLECVAVRIRKIHNCAKNWNWDSGIEKGSINVRAWAKRQSNWMCGNGKFGISVSLFEPLSLFVVLFDLQCSDEGTKRKKEHQHFKKEKQPSFSFCGIEPNLMYLNCF